MKIFTGIFAIVIAVASLWVSIKFLRSYIKVKNWERVQATIESKSITIHERYSTSKSPYKLNATYSYNFKNANYTGHLVYMEELSGAQVNHMKSDAEKKLTQISDTMFVYVNPDNPGEAVMYCTGAGLYSFVFLMGIFALVFGVYKLMQ